MRRNNLLKTGIILIAFVWSIIVLLPTIQLSGQKKAARVHYANIEKNTSLDENEIKAALSANNLPLRVRNTFTGDKSDSLDNVLVDVESLKELNRKIESNEPKSIKLGLDLQGGAYLVYEVDLPKLADDLTKTNDEAFSRALTRVKARVDDTNDDFFDVLAEIFAADSLRLGRYFGNARDEDGIILSELRTQAEDAIDRTLAVLRNRIDQYGVSEPSITKQGDLRIVVELAGIEDVGRAKELIGKTAQLTFRLEKEPEVVNAVLADIDLLLKKRRGDKIDSTSADIDSSVAQQKIRQESVVKIEEIFGPAGAGSGVADGDSELTVVVDPDFLQEKPFSALLGNFGGDIAIPVKNVAAVEGLINDYEVQRLLPSDAEFLRDAEPTPVGDQSLYRLYLVKKEPELRGVMIADANVQIGGDMQTGQSVVTMDLTNEGGKIFSRVTGANIGKRLAIVLDQRIVSIPVIQDRIPGGRARITGMSDIEEAKDLSIVLRAGALPAPIKIIEERTVGPSLGADSIRSGTRSALVGLLIVIVFMAIYYRLSGLIADVALLFNLVIVMAFLAGFHATLTLPGVAGMILTIGMAVDANVLIFERIREELRSGKTIRAAIDSGYARAFKTIMDANVTTLLMALVLYQFGTGPIKGFALTLSIGIMVSMFTAIVLTRVIFDYFTNKRTIKTLSI